NTRLESGRTDGVAEAGRSRLASISPMAFQYSRPGRRPIRPKSWDFRVMSAVETPQRWTWDEFQTLPRETVTVDIHSVTKGSKFDTRWSGFSLDTILGAAKPQAAYVLAFCDGDYVTNLPLADMMGHQAWIVDSYAGAPLPLEHD